MRKRTPEELLAADAKAQERNKEAAARVAARRQSATGSAPPQAQESAIGSYAGMTATQRREKAAGLKDGGTVGGFKPGGLIVGPGTGTSDSIETEKRPGTFIMPADSTQAIGPEALEKLGELGERDDMGESEDDEREDEGKVEAGKTVPVNLSNGEFELAPEQVQALGEAVLTVMRDATHTPVGEAKPVAGGFAPNQFFANGGTVQDEERARRLAQIPTGSNVPVPPSDGSESTELSRNVNNGLNALGGMGVVASAPLRVGQTAKAVASGAPALPAPARAAAAPAADFVAGMGPKATTYANSIPRLGNAPTPTLPAVNAALQEGAQANVMSAAARTAAGANAAATGAPSTQPAAAASTQPSQQPSEYGRQMSQVGNAFADGAAWLGKTIVSAPGYGFNRPDTPVPMQRTASTAGAGRGSVNPPAVVPAKADASQQSSDTMAGPPMEASSSVVRNGNSYSGTNIAGDVTFRNPDGSVRQAGGSLTTLPAGASPMAPSSAGFVPGAISPQSMGAADALAAREYAASMGRLMASGQIAPPAAGPSLNLPGGSFGFRRDRNIVADERGAQARFAYGQGTDPASRARNARLEQAAMQEAGSLARTGIQERGATAREAGRTAVSQGELELKRTAAGFQTRAAQQLEGLQTAYASEKDPTKRADLARQIREIQGKEQPARYKVAAGGQQIDATGVAYKVPDRVFNEQTGQFMDGQPEKPTLPPGMTKQVGTSNGRPVYEDAKGNRFVG